MPLPLINHHTLVKQLFYPNTENDIEIDIILLHQSYDEHYLMPYMKSVCVFF